MDSRFLSYSNSSSIWWKVTDLRLEKDLALAWVGFPNAFSEIFGRFLCGEKSVADFERRCGDRRTIGGTLDPGGGHCRGGCGGFPLLGVIDLILLSLIDAASSDRKMFSWEAPGWARFPKITESPLMPLPKLLTLDSRRIKDFCDPREVTARPVSCALQRVAMFRDESLRLRCNTAWRFCDPMIVLGIGGLPRDDWEPRRPDEEVRELLTGLSRPRRSEVATEAASPSRVASSSFPLEVLASMLSPKAGSWCFRCLGVVYSKNNSSSSTIRRALSTS